MGNDELEQWVGRLAEARVTCIGDVMLDRFVYGTVSRISPEAPIPVLQVKHEHESLGGVGNVARNLSSIGAHCRLIAAIGDDASGREVADLLAKLPNCRSELTTSPTLRTTTKCRYISGSQHMLRIDRESPAPAADRTGAHLPSVAGDLGGVVVISDYGKGVVTKENVRAVIREAVLLGAIVIVDPKGRDFSRYSNATIVTPNRNELREATGMAVESIDEVNAAARSLINRFGFRFVLTTLSEQGMLLTAAEGPTEHLAAEARDVYDVSGAGDTVVAVLAASLSIGLSPLQGAQLANVAGGIVVGKVGTAVVRPEELVAALRKRSVRVQDKIVSAIRAQEIIDRWRRDGKRVGFTNGCFDLLHPGHVSLLTNSAAKVDRLVVGLNSDASVRRLKGPTRPVQTETARAVVLASLESVSLVVIFEEDTPEKLLHVLRPDALIKGADYTIAAVVGADFVHSYGGQVLLIDLVPHQSTTTLVQRINAGDSPLPSASDAKHSGSGALS
jgi:D-beta-D-heptose 7-phosphate kinase/D-beta-D-heptose 1-phosphate adenosyltransferase